MENFKIYRRHEKDCPLFSEGMKSDIKKCSCPLWVHGSENGKRIRKSLKTRTVSRGLERLVRMQREPVGPPGPPAMPLDKAVETYLADCATRNLAASSIRNYRSHLKLLVDFFPGGLVRALTAASVADFRSTHPCGQAAASTRLSLIVLRTFFRFSLDRNWINENPAIKMKLPKPDSKTTLPYTDEEINRMLAACDRIKDSPKLHLRTRKRARALLLLLLYSGLRISDAVKLKRDAVEFTTGKVLLRIMKTRAPFYIKLPQDALDALQALPVESPYFFWSGKSALLSAIDAASKTIYAVGKRAEVAGARPHRFRDTFSVTLLQNGTDIRTVQMLLGHSSVVTTEKHYAPFVIGMQRVADEAVSTLHFGRSRTPTLVDTLRHARGDAQRNARRPLPLARQLGA